jgi:hypothetical protein
MPVHYTRRRHGMRSPVRGRLRILVVNIAGVLVILFFLGLLVYGAYLVVHGGRWCSAHSQAGSLASV